VVLGGNYGVGPRGNKGLHEEDVFMGKRGNANAGYKESPLNTNSQNSGRQ